MYYNCMHYIRKHTHTHKKNKINFFDDHDDDDDDDDDEINQSLREYFKFINSPKKLLVLKKYQKLSF